LDIIPWPVIESKEFYKSFTTLKRRLDLQRVSHPTAGEFLHTIKTLMAKIKVCHLFRFDIVLIIYLQANDWGALSRSLLHPSFSSLEFILSTETMAEHRAKSLSALLQIALATGFSEIDPELEHLKVP
jgi:hypothetical protein